MTIKPRLVYCAAVAALAITVTGCSSTPKLSKPLTHAKGPSTGQQMKAGGLGSGANQNNLSGPPASVGYVVYFDFDSSVIKPEYQGVVAAHGSYLQSHAASHVTLEGNTDERGSREYNLALGQRRAEAVQNALLLQGGASNQIEAVSFGAEKPANSGHDEMAYAKNRRTEFRYR